MRDQHPSARDLLQMSFSEVLTPIATAHTYLQLLQRAKQLPQDERDAFLAAALRQTGRAIELARHARKECDAILSPEHNDSVVRQRRDKKDGMRVLIVPRDEGDEQVAWIFLFTLQQERPAWDVLKMDPVEPRDFIKQMAFLDADCVLIADNWHLISGHFVRYTETIPLPIIAVFAYFTPDAARALRRNSIYPIAAPCDMDELLTTIETQVPLLRDEIASPDRAQLARAAAERFFSKR